MRIGIQRDIRDRILLAHQIRRAGELMLHHVQRLVTAFLQLFIFVATIFRQAQIELDKPRYCNIRLVTVLLEELPLQNLGTQAWFARQELTAVSEEVEDRVRLPQVSAVLKFQHRDLAIGILGQKLGSLGVALQNIHALPLELEAQQIEHQLDLVAVARTVIAINLVHSPSP